MHVVIDSVPGRTEAALVAVGIIGDDVDAGNMGHIVHRNVVVGDASTLLLWEVTAVAGDGCCLSYALYDI